MQRMVAAVVVCGLLGGMAVGGAEARSRRQGEPAAVSSVSTVGGVAPQQGLEEILDLWRDGRYEALYGRTTPSGRTTKETFLKKMAGASRRPAASWEKMQEVSVTMAGDDSASVHARLGLDAGPGATEFSTRSYRLVREEGVWKISQADLLALAGGKATKKRSRRAVTRR